MKVEESLGASLPRVGPWGGPKPRLGVRGKYTGNPHQNTSLQGSFCEEIAILCLWLQVTVWLAGREAILAYGPHPKHQELMALQSSVST